MKNNCNCSYCQEHVNVYFCGPCGYNFNPCEVVFEYFPDEEEDLPKFGISLCPKCHPDCDENKEQRLITGHIKRKIARGTHDFPTSIKSTVYPEG